MSVALVLALLVVMQLGGVWRMFAAGERIYHVVFDVEEGVKNLSSGADVRVGGLTKGRVEDVQLRGAAQEEGAPAAETEMDEEGERVAGMDPGAEGAPEPELKSAEPGMRLWVRFTLDEGIPLYRNAKIVVGSSIIGSDA